MVAPGARKYIYRVGRRKQEAWLCSRFCDVPFFLAARHEIRPTRKERERGLSSFISRLTPGIFYLLNSARRRKRRRVGQLLEAVILFTGSQNYDGRKVNARRCQGMEAKRASRRKIPVEEMKESSGCARTKILSVFSVEGEERGRTFRHFITRLSRVSYLLTFVDREPGCTRKKRRRACIRLSEFLFSPPSLLSSTVS